MKLFKTFFAIFFFITALNIFAKEKVIINITIEHQPSQGMVKLKQFDEKSGIYRDFKNFVFVGNKTFRTEFNFDEPDFYQIDLFEKHLFKIAVTGAQNLSIKIDLYDPEKFEVFGSNETQILHEIEKKNKTLRDSLVNPLFLELVKAKRENNNEKVVSLTQLYRNNNEIYKDDLKSYLNEINSFSKIYAFNFMDIAEDFEFLSEMVNELKLKYPDSDLIKFYEEKLTNYKAQENKK